MQGDSTLEAITAFYDATLSDMGYTLAMSGEESGVTYLMFQKGSSSVAIGVLPSTEGHLVQITVIP